MSEQIFCELGFLGTVFAAGLGNKPKLQIDFPHSNRATLKDGYIQISKEEAEVLGLALLNWSKPTIFDPGELNLDERRKSFEFSTECPRCRGRFILMYLSKTQW